jgi:hypothetical protein
MAQKFVNDRLKAPATADFQSCREAKVAPQTEADKGGGYAVFSHVDVQNSFGAKIRTSYLAVVQYAGYDDTRHNYDWNLVTLTMNEQTWANPDLQVPCPK